jgi:cytochrome c peroxidase
VYDNLPQADRDIVTRIYVNYGKALAAYVRTLVSRNSRFDRFVAGDDSALSDSEKRGLKVFLASGCVDCHSGPNFSDNQFHALGALGADLGRHPDSAALLASPFTVNSTWSDDVNTGKLTGLAQVDAMKGQFRTKSLRNISGAGPYMHAGQLATLEAVVDFYDMGGGDSPSGVVKDTKMMPLGLAAGEKTDLVAFLRSLSGEGLAPATVVDLSK